MSTKVLHLDDGPDMPRLGFGTFELTGVTCRHAVRLALEAGYRHVDTARMYDNEGDVGGAIREAQVPREELFLTTKIWLSDLSPAGVEDQLTRSLRLLGTDHVDLALIHWPSEDEPLEKTLDALMEQRKKERLRHIGVSNFTPSLVDRAAKHAPIRCNQVEYHPLLDQSRLRDQARRLGLALTAYSPLAQGKVLEEEEVKAVARRRERTPAQVVLRWLIQQDPVAAIPRSSRPEHIESNLRVFDFQLDEKDMDTLTGLARGDRQIDPEWAPDWGS